MNDEEDNNDDDKSDTEDDTVVDSVDTLPNDIFTEYWDVLEEEQDETGFKKVPSLYRIMICLTFKDKLTYDSTWRRLTTLEGQFMLTII